MSMDLGMVRKPDELQGEGQQSTKIFEDLPEIPVPSAPKIDYMGASIDE